MNPISRVMMAVFGIIVYRAILAYSDKWFGGQPILF